VDILLFEKLFFPAVEERPEEAPGTALEKRLFKQKMERKAGMASDKTTM